jgi:hypothetical protein
LNVREPGDRLQFMTRPFLLLATAVLLSTTAAAQDVPRAGVIAGIVRDAAGAPIAGAEIALEESKELVLTGEDGAFRIALPTGSHTILVRRMGFEPRRTPIRVADGHVKLELTLKPLPAELAKVRSTAKHIGLTGFITDTAGTKVGQATIRVYPGLPEPDTLRSHSIHDAGADGGFFIPLAPGRYTVRVGRENYPVATFVVSVPRNGGRCVMVRLGADEKQQGAACPQSRP